MTIDERIEFLLKVQESHEANLNRLFELHGQTEQALGRFISRTDETLDTMARILEGGAQ
jgi:hypothetical protein